ncbi:MAG: protein kinase, partial [Planctomycetota bacterium]|nr:protein kinase [Planctomycetota bacterium]
MSATVHTTSSRLAVLMFTDVVGSSELKSRLGTPAYASLIARHDVLFRQLLASYPSAELLQDTGDGYFAAFRTVSDAVRFALRFQDAMHREPWGIAEPLKTRVGIHLGELALIAGESDGPAKVVGMAADVAARLMSLARGGQILLTRAAFDEARQFVGEYPADNGHPQPRALRWMAHGEYIFQGTTEPIEVFEVGGDGIAPLAPPRDREKARRSIEGGQDEILGWRPAIGLAVPQAPAWLLERKLGEGTFGEVWLARHQKLKQNRVFKFCFDAERLESFKRELTLFRLLRDALGERPDITRLYDVCLDHPPYFLESEFAPAGNLIDWAASQGGLHGVPMTTRLEMVAQVCDAVAAAHSVGVLHKDIKPSNILVHVAADGAPRPQLTDFGIGMLTDKAQLAARQITEAGFTTMTTAAESSRSGTRIYAPPESLTGRPFTTQGDIYALGVLLYQMTIADLDRPLALGWERRVEDELLREDIATCVDGDPERRINSAAEVASRLRHLPERREQRAAEAAHRETSRRRHRLLRIAAVVSVILVALSALAVVGFFRERRLRVAAQTAYATGAVDQGVALHLAGRATQSRAAFVRARETFAHLGASTLAAEVGLYRSLREFEPPIATMTGPDGVMAVAWLPDGRRVVSAGDGGSLKLWDALTGRLLRTFVESGPIVSAVAISPSGTQLVSAGGKDEPIRLWDVEGGKELTTFGKPGDKAGREVRGLAFSPDGQRIAAGWYG